MHISSFFFFPKNVSICWLEGKHLHVLPLLAHTWYTTWFEANFLIAYSYLAGVSAIWHCFSFVKHLNNFQNVIITQKYCISYYYWMLCRPLLIICWILVWTIEFLLYTFVVTIMSSSTFSSFLFNFMICKKKEKPGLFTKWYCLGTIFERKWSSSRNQFLLLFCEEK